MTAETRNLHEDSDCRIFRSRLTSPTVLKIGPINVKDLVRSFEKSRPNTKSRRHIAEDLNLMRFIYEEQSCSRRGLGNFRDAVQVQTYRSGVTPKF
jgi:hypothetical protein